MAEAAAEGEDDEEDDERTPLHSTALLAGWARRQVIYLPA